MTIHLAHPPAAEEASGRENGSIVARLDNALHDLALTARASLVHIAQGRRSHGAGTIWHAGGLIITNAHVVAGRRRNGPLEVTLPDGQQLPARRLAIDRARDLAALAVDAEGLPTVALGETRAVRPGQWVMAIGHPWGVNGALTGGTVIAVGPPPEMPGYPGDLVQVDLHLRPGHSGGALLDGHGRLIGINTMIAGPNVGLAVPVVAVKRFLQESLGNK